MAWIWDGTGTGLRRVWDGSGTGLRRVWDGTGTGLRRVWDRSGTGLRWVWGRSSRDRLEMGLGQVWDGHEWLCTNPRHDHTALFLGKPVWGELGLAID